MTATEETTKLSHESLAGKTIIVIGASRGLGKALSTALENQGCTVIRGSRTGGTYHTDRLSNWADVSYIAQDCIHYKVDILNPLSVNELMQNLEQKSINGIVNCAASINPIGPLGMVDLEEWIYAIQVNLIGPAVLFRAAIPYLQNSCSIIQLSGGGATKPMAGFSAYAASKAGVVRLIETLSLEYPQFRFNSVAPGLLPGAIRDQIIQAGKDKAGQTYSQAYIADKSKVDNTSKAVGLILYLLSDASKHVNGRLISAAWDRWPFNLDDMRLADWYTLRRMP